MFPSALIERCIAQERELLRSLQQRDLGHDADLLRVQPPVGGAAAPQRFAQLVELSTDGLSYRGYLLGANWEVPAGAELITLRCWTVPWGERVDACVPNWTPATELSYANLAPVVQRSLPPGFPLDPDADPLDGWWIEPLLIGGCVVQG